MIDACVTRKKGTLRKLMNKTNKNNNCWGTRLNKWEKKTKDRVGKSREEFSKIETMTTDFLETRTENVFILSTQNSHRSCMEKDQLTVIILTKPGIP